MAIVGFLPSPRDEHALYTSVVSCKLPGGTLSSKKFPYSILLVVLFGGLSFLPSIDVFILSLISLPILRASTIWDPHNVLPVSKANFIKLDSNSYFIQNASVHIITMKRRRSEAMRTQFSKGNWRELGFRCESCCSGGDLVPSYLTPKDHQGGNSSATALGSLFQLKPRLHHPHWHSRMGGWSPGQASIYRGKQSSKRVSSLAHIPLGVSSLAHVPLGVSSLAHVPLGAIMAFVAL